MSKRALIDKRPILLASMAAALVYFVLRQSPVVPELWLVPLKGSAVGLLAIYAFVRFHVTDSRILGAMFVLAALGDMAIEWDFVAGAILFLGYHMAAIGLYLRHPREAASGSQKAAAVAMLLATPAIFWLLPADRSMAWPTALYGLALGAMAACAWLSAFSRYRVGVGAVLFLVSDLLIVAGMGPLMGERLHQWLIWPLYYIGQLLVCLGVVQRLQSSGERAS
ncbi:MAG: lysoplasmalogenase family protein [Croceibacterium sp.]